MELSIDTRRHLFMNPQDVSFDHAWLRYPSLAETTVLCQMLFVQIRLRDDAFMGT